MHECPECYEQCYCDMDDLDLGELPPSDCPHVCKEQNEYGEYDD